ncbi:hypothetical protein [Shewanella insulae]|uniref:hypothetical protein n=1 Tax=Shewanella insulae TaxID=2681496 RepID=UPI002480264E|nr:hypothetical protein [Shewanella insulae]
MLIAGAGDRTYILLSGIKLNKVTYISKNVKLLPADTSHLDFNTALSTCSRPDDVAVIAAFIPSITAQFEIVASTPKELAFSAWNSTWDALLLAAIFHTEVSFNIQSDTEASLISAQSNLRATNFHFRGLTLDSPKELSEEDLAWIDRHFNDARILLENEKFQTAVHCLASYRWHSIPRIKMAVLWAGVEAMFGASTEIRFRLSLCIARFLHPNDAESRKFKFDLVKKLYNSRSSAVHGAKIKGDLSQTVDASANLLRELIHQSILNGAMPNEDDLVP